jgi:hypothetical protein
MTPLTPRELAIKNKLYNQYKQNADEFVKDYGSDAEQVMLGRAIKLAKSMAAKDDKQKIKEMIKKALQGPISETEEINSMEYVQNRRPAESNPEDVIKLDVPLLIRIMEYAREDAKTDMDLHFAAENMVQLSKTNRTLNMDDYKSIISPYTKIDQND